MQLTIHPYSLKFNHPFGVSGHTRSETASVFVKLEQDGICGYGEACLPAYLGETVHETLAFLEKCRTALEKYNFQAEAELFLKSLDLMSAGCNAAKAAVDVALFDWLAKRDKLPFYTWKNIPHLTKAITSFTIGIDESEEKLSQKISEACDFKVLKIKAGTLNDVELIERVRRCTDKPLFVDVNQGWKDKHQALELATWMNTRNVLLLEQPLPKSMMEETRWLTERSPIPTFADESVKRLEDLKQMNGAFAGINIKLMKCTGLREALAMIEYCKTHGIKIMLGCMAESSCGTAAMAQLMAFADFIDLDAPQLYSNDPFSGLNYQDGQIMLSREAGMGVRPLITL